MHYGNIKPFSVENGDGIRVSLFVSGCRNCCNGCFSKNTWNFGYGEEYTRETKDNILSLLKPDYIKGITVLGGEPLEPENQECVLNLLKAVKEELPSKDVWLYTGFTLEDIFADGCRANTGMVAEIIKNVDILVDGKFDEEKKNIALKFRGSENQRVIDLKETAKQKEVVLKYQ